MLNIGIIWENSHSLSASSFVCPTHECNCNRSHLFSDCPAKPWFATSMDHRTAPFLEFYQYLCFCLVRILSTYTCSSKCKGLSTAWGRGPWWTSLHTALSAPVSGQGSEAIRSRLEGLILSIKESVSRAILSTETADHSVHLSLLISCLIPLRGIFQSPKSILFFELLHK